ncbi:hypothetical protein D0O09_31785, partial [Pseudomonas putida]
MLERYRNHVENKLKEDAGQRLVVAISEQEGKKARAKKRTPYKGVYRKSSEWCANLAGQLMIGVEKDDRRKKPGCGKCARPSVKEVLAIFDLVDGEWRQRESKRPSLV